ncbi:hypothetical protein QYM36_018180 [Artemia franciscana]|uniref:Uncharacterized protein n=1 Tax=Artemia franciscana TaxID=6661 RepID=A0AA88H2R6_ARTSF|nr:hypothetical protein QYM36_018180 [Artemia franciscana]
MQVEMPEQSSQVVQTKGASDPKSSDILQIAIDLILQPAEELQPDEGDDEYLFRDLQSIFDPIEGSGIELKPTKSHEELLKERTSADDLNGLEGSAHKMKPPKSEGDLLRDQLNDLLNDISNFEDDGDKLKPPKAYDENHCDGEFDSSRENKDMMAQGTCQKRKLLSNHIEYHLNELSSNTEIDLQPLKKKQKGTATQEKSQQRKSNSCLNDKEEKPLLEKRPRQAEAAKKYRINRTVDRRLLEEDISTYEKEIAALEKEISNYKRPFSSPVVTEQNGAALENHCDSEFDSKRENKDMMAQGTCQKRKLPSNHIEYHVDDLSSNTEIELQPLNKKQKATAIQEKSQQRKSNSCLNDKEEKSLLEKRPRWVKASKKYRINKTVDRRLLMEDIHTYEKEIAALEKEISNYKLGSRATSSNS